jgi:hypothetical protein
MLPEGGPGDSYRPALSAMMGSKAKPRGSVTARLEAPPGVVVLVDLYIWDLVPDEAVGPLPSAQEPLQPEHAGDASEAFPPWMGKSTGRRKGLVLRLLQLSRNLPG